MGCDANERAFQLPRQGRMMQDRLPKTGKLPTPSPPSPRGPQGSPDPGLRIGEVPRVFDAHARSCSTCREDLAVPELNYRLVLRCTTTGPDH